MIANQEKDKQSTVASPYQFALKEAQATLQALDALEGELKKAAQWCLEVYKRGHKIIALGNGGSACGRRIDGQVQEQSPAVGCRRAECRRCSDHLYRQRFYL
jgi:hypothetical protein